MTPEQINELDKLCEAAFKLAMNSVKEYTEQHDVDDFDTFRFLMYQIIVNRFKIERLEERINELEQKQKAHDNA